QPEWTQFKDETTSQLAEIMISVESFEGDDNEKIQQAINRSVDLKNVTVYIPDNEYSIDVTKYSDISNSFTGISVKSNTKIKIHPNAILKAKTTDKEHHSIFS